MTREQRFLEALQSIISQMSYHQIEPPRKEDMRAWREATAGLSETGLFCTAGTGADRDAAVGN